MQPRPTGASQELLRLVFSVLLSDLPKVKA